MEQEQYFCLLLHSEWQPNNRELLTGGVREVSSGINCLTTEITYYQHYTCLNDMLRLVAKPKITNVMTERCN
jgi:hypothetical protein